MRKTLVMITALVLLLAPAASFTSSNDIPSLNVIFKGDLQVYSINLENRANTSETVTIDVRGEVAKFLEVEESVELAPNSQKRVIVKIEASNTTTEDLLIGNLILSGTERQQNIPIGLRIVEKEDMGFKADIQATSENVRPGQNVTVLTVLSNNGDSNISASVRYEVRRAITGKVKYNTTRNVTFKGVKSYKKHLQPRDMQIGDYYVQAHVNARNTTLSVSDPFRVSDPFWTPLKIKAGLALFAAMIVIGGGAYTYRWYEQRRKEESRYVFPVDYSKLPEGEDLFEVGKIAETEKTAYIDPKDLTTHAIVAGSTGSGKSVTANIIAEEALEKDIPVIVFDPTAQWTGFVKELKDDNLLEHYERFDMDQDKDPHPYRGVIKEVKSEDPDINFEDLRNPGEITVFTLNQLTTEQFDQAVRNIIEQIFDKDWEESPTLELFIVFDEVHRLLEEYGGQGGYHALERGAREFRKWGIGLMMCSQVTADFKQAISGNIMTEVQMQTKSMEDIERVEKKYGEEFAKRISSEDVGVGMVQNSNYNDGEPWFVDFRPTYHNPHKIPDKELNKYHELSSELDDLKQKLNEMEEQGEDIKDKELELNLADNKLKEGRFKMAKMYIDSLKDELGIS